MGTNWSIGSSIWTRGRASSLWGWQSTGTGCPGRLWILLLWRYSNTTWTRSCATYSRWPCFGRMVGLDDPQRSLPTPAILWFCVILSFWTSFSRFIVLWQRSALKWLLEALVEQVNRYPAFLLVHHSLSIVFVNIICLPAFIFLAV